MLIRAAILLACLVATSAASAGPLPAHEHHVRLRTVHGAIHVWSPEGYDPHTAAVVVYVHGYFASVDDAWTDYRLAAQFRASRLNALFIACEAPIAPEGDVTWSSLGDLLHIVETYVGPLPHGRRVAMGHSGAHRTLAAWLDEPTLDTVALVDAAYGDLGVYETWLAQRPDRRLIDVGDLTRATTDEFHRRLPETVVVDRFQSPGRGGLPEAAADARVVYVRSYMGHMALVTGGVAIPMLLRVVMAPLVVATVGTEPLASP